MALGLRLAFLEFVFTLGGGVVEGAIILGIARIGVSGIHLPDSVSDGVLALLLGLFDLPGQILALCACIACLGAADGKAKGALIGALVSRAIGSLITVLGLIATASGSLNCYEEYAGPLAVFDWFYRLLFILFLCGVERSLKPKAKTNKLESFPLLLFFGVLSLWTGICLIIMMADEVTRLNLGCPGFLWLVFSLQYLAFLWRLSGDFRRHMTR